MSNTSPSDLSHAYLDPEKANLLHLHPPPPRNRQTHLKVALVATLSLLLLARQHLLNVPAASSVGSTEELCPQFEPLAPPKHASDSNVDFVLSPAYQAKSVELLSGLVQVPTPSYDDMGPVSGKDSDPRWEPFFDLAAYLRKSFPLV